MKHRSKRIDPIINRILPKDKDRINNQFHISANRCIIGTVLKKWSIGVMEYWSIVFNLLLTLTLTLLFSN